MQVGWDKCVAFTPVVEGEVLCNLLGGVKDILDQDISVILLVDECEKACVARMVDVGCLR